MFIINLSEYTIYFQVPPGGFKYHVLISGDQHNPEPIFYSHIQPQYAICRIGCHLPTFANVATFLRLHSQDPHEGVFSLAQLAGKCGDIYNTWVYYSWIKAPSENTAPSCSSHTSPRRKYSNSVISFSPILDGGSPPQQSACHSERRMWDDVRSSISEWVKKVKPGDLEEQDISRESNLDVIDSEAEEDVFH
jgi:hypothetical protein